jgi:3-deoxy-7-phosphoheptulonate synthase
MILVMNSAAEATSVYSQSKQLNMANVFLQDRQVGFADIKQAGDLPFNVNATAEIIEHHSALNSTRAFHPEDTIITTPHSVIGGDNFVLMAGPDSIESPEHVMVMGDAVKAAGATILRGGSFKPRTSPYSFQGLGEAGLQAHRQAADALGMDMVTEIMDTQDVALVDKYTDIFQVGTRNMQNFSLLKALGQTRKPVVLKRGMAASIDDWLNASEYIAAGGNTQIILMERGIRTFDNKYTRNTLDVGAIAVLRQLTHYPVLADPSHAAGDAAYVAALGRSAVAAGAQGLMVEIHDQPAKAFVDGSQALKPAEFKKLAADSFQIHDMLRGK